MIDRNYFAPYDVSKLLTISIQVYAYVMMFSNVTLFNCLTHC